jgi:hypothetical protein
MQRFFYVALLATVSTLAQEPPPPAEAKPANEKSGALNVNERYTIEAIDAKLPSKRKLSPDLRQKMDALVGHKLNQEKLDEVKSQLKAEFRNFKITQRVSKGDKPDHVKVLFELERNSVEVMGDSDDFKAIYHSKNNWSFGGTFRVPLGDSGFGLLAGALTDNDLRVERFSGARGGIDKLAFHNNVRFQFIGESYRSQWNGATRAANPDNSEIYRARQNFEPTVSFRPVGPLTVTAGFSLARYQYQFPAARYLSANAVISSLRFARQWENTSGIQQSLEAGYDLRAATSSLGSDTRFTRHFLNAHYETKHGPHEFFLDARGGSIGGRAPLYEAFVLGNTQTLRGWNRFDVAPLGGNRMAHGSAEYRYRGFRFLYDTGAVWQAPVQEAKQRHAAAIGYIDSGIAILVAFPIRDGNVTPLVMLGYTF